MQSIVKVYIPPFVVFVRFPKRTRSPAGIRVSINATCHTYVTYIYASSIFETMCMKNI